MIFSDYLDQTGLILILLSILAILISIIFQKYKLQNKSFYVSSFLMVVFFTSYMAFGLFLDQSKISKKDINEVQLVLDRFEKNKDALLKSKSLNSDYLQTINKLKLIVSSKNATYKDLGDSGYVNFRDHINLKLYNIYRNS